MEVVRYRTRVLAMTEIRGLEPSNTGSTILSGTASVLAPAEHCGEQASFACHSWARTFVIVQLYRDSSGRQDQLNGWRMVWRQCLCVNKYLLVPQIDR